jgi:hypothetical protein
VSASARTQPQTDPASTGSPAQGTPAGEERVAGVSTDRAPQPAPAAAPERSPIDQSEARARRGEIYAVAGLAITVGQIIVTSLF